MHVYISVDMEGVAGVATKEQVLPGGSGYARAQALMTREANAAIAGAFNGGATKVTVNDSHGPMDNLLHDELDERARVVVGRPKAHGMVNGVTSDVDLAMFVGYHAAGGQIGVLAHSFSSAAFAEIRLNGEIASELRINSLFAAGCGVPTVLVSGDDVICAEARNVYPTVTAVEVKTVEGFTAANSMHPTAACAAIRQASEQAVRYGEHPVLDIPDRLLLEAEMTSATGAELASYVPGATRTGTRTVMREVDSPQELIGLISVWAKLG
ncbi:M55 family metallopeptidase [Natronoglycomyces albus]|uniref:M55 family metallopeptidase n=1 Tax=Natronoglycomyces albus TaxID=2811108 RepID=A0A895XPL1_9ACTN|nr:M55 family metallopeptidase [Natronoglycomyces albus]QSB04466.1 M55 family metallopeptidase [Natronoglycomyces albus]